MKVPRFLAVPLYLGLMLGLSAAGISYTTLLLAHCKGHLFAPFCVFFSTLFSYHLNRKGETHVDEITNRERIECVREHRWVDWVFVVGFCASLGVSILSGSIPAVLLLLAFPVAVLLYTNGPSEREGRPAVQRGDPKHLFFIKNVYVAFFWGLVPLYSVAFCRTPIDEHVLALSGFVFLRWLINTIAFDVKDVDSDKIDGTSTLPVRFGIPGTRHILHAINVLSCFYLILCLRYGLFPPLFVGLFVAVAYAFFFINRLGTVAQRVLLYETTIDGECACWPLFIAVACWLS